MQASYTRNAVKRSERETEIGMLLNAKSFLEKMGTMCHCEIPTFKIIRLSGNGLHYGKEAGL